MGKIARITLRVIVGLVAVVLLAVVMSSWVGEPHGAGIQGVVISPDSKPAAGAGVWRLTAGEMVEMMNGVVKPKDGAREVKTATDGDGRFELPATNSPYQVLAVSEAGIALATEEQLAVQEGVITLAQWGRIEGEYYIGTKPAVERDITLLQVDFPEVGEGAKEFYINCEAYTDNAGHFALNKVAPGRTLLAGGMGNEYYVVEAGQTLHVRLGGKGGLVTCRLVLPEGVEDGTSHLLVDAGVWTVRGYEGDMAHVPWPQDSDWMTGTELRKWGLQWTESPAGRKILEEVKAAGGEEKGYPLYKTKDGRFMAENIPPGKCMIIGGAFEHKDDHRMKQVASLHQEFDMPQVAEGELDVPLDLGEVKMKPMELAGSIAPALELDGPQGEKMRLSDYKGKVMLVCFYSVDDPWDAEEYTNLKRVYEKFGIDDGFAMMGAVFGSRYDLSTKAMVKERGLPWPQGYTGPRGRDLSFEYCLRDPPYNILIGRDGRVIVARLSGKELMKKVKDALER